MDGQGLAPYIHRDGFQGINRRAPPKLVPTRAAGTTLYNMQSSLGRHNILSSLPAWLYLRRQVLSTTPALLTGLYRLDFRTSGPAELPSNNAELASLQIPTRGSRR
jgi:hypothetical protein